MSRNRTVWTVEREGRTGNWSVSSIHYTRNAARRQKKRDTEGGLSVRVRKYVPFDQYEKTLRSLENRVSSVIDSLETQNRYSQSENFTTESASVAETTTKTQSQTPRAGTLTSTTF